MRKLSISNTKFAHRKGKKSLLYKITNHYCTVIIANSHTPDNNDIKYTLIIFFSVSRVKRSGVYAYPAYGHMAVPVVAGPKGPTGTKQQSLSFVSYFVLARIQHYSIYTILPEN